MSKIEKIAVNGHYVWVDKDAEIKEGDYCLHNNIIKQAIGDTIPFANKCSEKIIAASPELELEGVPDWVEFQATEYASKRIELDPVYSNGLYYGFLEGHRVARKELFTEDDVRKAIEFGIGLEAGNIERDFKNFKTNESQFIQQLKSQKK